MFEQLDEQALRDRIIEEMWPSFPDWDYNAEGPGDDEAEEAAKVSTDVMLPGTRNSGLITSFLQPMKSKKRPRWSGSVVDEEFEARAGAIDVDDGDEDYVEQGQKRTTKKTRRSIRSTKKVDYNQFYYPLDDTV